MSKIRLWRRTGPSRPVAHDADEGRRGLSAGIRRLRDDEKGSVLVETLMVLPIVTILTMGAIEMSFVYVTYSSMMDAAREGARALARGAVDLAGARTVTESRLIFKDPDKHYTITAKNPHKAGSKDVSVAISLPIEDATATGLLGFGENAKLSVEVVMLNEQTS